MNKSELEFWFDFASPYAYVSAARIVDWSRDAGIAVKWMPFLLGPVFKKQGWDTSPFNIYPNKGRYMWRDVERLCKRNSLAFTNLEVFPQNSLLATRVAVAARDEEWLPDYCKSLLEHEFAKRMNIADKSTVESVLSKLTDDAVGWLGKADDPNIKQAVKDRGQEANAKKIFGSPTFITPDGELFWGDDRLEQAIEWILKHR